MMNSSAEPPVYVEDFLYDVPEIVQEYFGDQELNEIIERDSSCWKYSYDAKNTTVFFLVDYGFSKFDNSVLIDSGTDEINISGSLSESQKKRLDELIKLSFEVEFYEFAVERVKNKKKHHHFERLSSDDRYSSLIRVTNSFIEVRDMLERIEDEELILELFDYNPLEKLKKLEQEVNERSYRREF